ncbi:hypothetical protein NXS19_000569 [Fusarium pseudograminearum]|nr:hypothetical protein NXS19_000569 [Fusarium pseudograminearum]
MTGTETSNAGGGFDLLRRATQAMMSRSVADEDNVDHIGVDTPRSGVATPQPDLQDKRLPSIMSYFGQSGNSTPTRAMSAARPSASERAPPPGEPAMIALKSAAPILPGALAVPRHPLPRVN